MFLPPLQFQRVSLIDDIRVSVRNWKSYPSLLCGGWSEMGVSKKQFMKGELSPSKAVEWDLLWWCLFLTTDVWHASLGWCKWSVGILGFQWVLGISGALMPQEYWTIFGKFCGVSKQRFLLCNLVFTVIWRKALWKSMQPSGLSSSVQWRAEAWNYGVSGRQ